MERDPHAKPLFVSCNFYKLVYLFTCFHLGHCSGNVSGLAIKPLLRLSSDGYKNTLAYCYQGELMTSPPQGDDSQPRQLLQARTYLARSITMETRLGVQDSGLSNLTVSAVVRPGMVKCYTQKNLSNHSGNMINIEY